MSGDDTGRGSALWRPAARPQWVQEINALGRDLQASGERLLALDADTLLSQARTRTGLSDFGSDDFLEGLEVLTRALEEEAELTLMGRILAQDEIVNGLEWRLRIEAAFREHPEIAEEIIEAPIMIGARAGAARRSCTSCSPRTRPAGHRSAGKCESLILPLGMATPASRRPIAP